MAVLLMITVMELRGTFARLFCVGVPLCFLCYGVDTHATGAEGVLGAFDEARQEYPELFTPGLVNRFEIQGRTAYVVCSAATRDFDAADEPDAELMKERDLKARWLLLNYISDGKPEQYEIDVAGIRPLYTWRKANAVAGNYYAFVDEILVKKRNSKQPIQMAGGTSDVSQATAGRIRWQPVSSATGAGASNGAAGCGEAMPTDGKAPTDVSHVHEQVEALFELGRYEEARVLLDAVGPEISVRWGTLPEKVCLHAAVAAAKGTTDTLVQLADIYYLEGDSGRAGALYEQASTQQGLQGRIRKKALYRAGLCAVRQGQPSRAAEFSRTLQKEYPTSELGTRLAGRGDGNRKEEIP